MRKLHNILVTGGAGFIGSNFINYLFNLLPITTNFTTKEQKEGFCDSTFTGNVVNVDCLTYAGNLENLKEVQDEYGGKRYFFEKVNICDAKEINRIFSQYDIDTVVHFAADSHVDRSILNPGEFITTNIVGTYTLLEAARSYWDKKGDKESFLFHHISTDEVYGSLGEEGYFTEETPYDPRSPYSASKASSDHLVLSYFHTYGLPVTLTNCSNNYGPYQFPEKLLPLMISNIKSGLPLPVYGKGINIRDWIYVGDHNRAVWQVLQRGKLGSKYNIGGENEWQNIKLLNKVIELESAILGLDCEEVKKSIEYVKDRPGHDARYAIDCTKIKKVLGWKRLLSFTEGLNLTINWYLSNEKWLEHIKTGEYKTWLTTNYLNR